MTRDYSRSGAGNKKLAIVEKPVVVHSTHTRLLSYESRQKYVLEEQVRYGSARTRQQWYAVPGQEVRRSRQEIWVRGVSIHSPGHEPLAPGTPLRRPVLSQKTPDGTVDTTSFPHKGDEIPNVEKHIVVDLQQERAAGTKRTRPPDHHDGLKRQVLVHVFKAALNDIVVECVFGEDAVLGCCSFGTTKKESHFETAPKRSVAPGFPDYASLFEMLGSRDDHDKYFGRGMMTEVWFIDYVAVAICVDDLG